ncbi:dipeptide epimerase [bacterium]|nr:dipeptide epimerase [bacterium]
MKITEIQIGHLPIPLLKTFKTALRTIDQIECLVVRMKTDSNLIGWGDSAPTAVITGDTTESIKGAISHIRPLLLGQNILDIETIGQKIQNSMVGNFSAKAALDMAVYDLLAKSYQVPLYQLLGGFRNQLTTDYTISIDDPEVMAKESQEMVSQGFKILKTKVGSAVQTDIQRLCAIREAVGPEIKILVDANQGWKPKEAVNAVRLLQQAGVNLEFVEQPVKREDFEGLRYVREHIDIPVVADESAFSPQDVLRLVKMHAVDGINIKLMKCGGIYQALKMVAIAESADITCMVGSMMEGPIGVTAIAHLAMAKSIITDVDLDAPLFCKEYPVKGGIIYKGAHLTLPEKPGLGVEPDVTRIRF